MATEGTAFPQYLSQKNPPNQGKYSPVFHLRFTAVCEQSTCKGKIKTQLKEGLGKYGIWKHSHNRGKRNT